MAEMIKFNDSNEANPIAVYKRNNTDLLAIWPKSEFEKLKNRARVLTTQDRMAIIDEAERDKLHLQEESNKRKQMFQKAYLEQKPKQGSKLSAVETEAAKKNLYVLQRAFELRYEQDDAIKNANALILATKCLAIREAQIKEQEVVKKDLEEENRRLDIMMEQERQKALKEEEFKNEAQEEKNKKYVLEVSLQIQQNEIEKLAEATRKQEESRNINKSLLAFQQEEARKQQQRKFERERIRNDLNQVNAEIERCKRLQQEEQRIADLHIQEFMRKKAEREAVREEELMQERLLKEREIAHLRLKQQKAQNQQDVADEIAVLRTQEEVERVWREREKMAANKRRELAEDLRNGRQQQVENRHKAKAMEIERDEQEYLKVAQIQYELYHKDLEKKRQRREAAIKHRNDLLRQMEEKQLEYIKEHQEKFDDGVALRLEHENHNKQIQNIIQKKVQRLKESNVSENFIVDLERQLKIKKK